jgi:hypothetical protein
MLVLKPMKKTLKGRRSSELLRARREKLLVKFSRPFEPGSFTGYVLDVGPKFFLLSVKGNDGERFNGYSCLRVEDVRGLEVPHPYASFHEAAQKKLGERRPRKPSISLGSLVDLIGSAARQFPLVTIHRERVDPKVCYIGRVFGIGREHVTLLEIGPDARWEKTPRTYRQQEITRVDFGGEYEKALYLVGGEPPKSN